MRRAAGSSEAVACLWSRRGANDDAYRGASDYDRPMPPRGTLRVIDAAEEFAAEVSRWLVSDGRACSHADQLRRSANSVSSNLIEGYGRGPGADRIRLYRIGKAECEEAMGWLRKSNDLSAIAPREFHRLSNRGS